MRVRHILRACALTAVVLFAAACSGPEQETYDPELAPRGTAMTTVKPTRQDLANRVSLSGTVTLNPVFGVVTPVKGEVRYLDLKPSKGIPTTPTIVAYVWRKGQAKPVKIPAGSIFAGRLVDDRATVPAGTPIASARRTGYGIVAEIEGTQAYQISDGLSSVQAQITNGPGPFKCTVLGTIAALPAGTIPEPPIEDPQPGTTPDPAADPGPAAPPDDGPTFEASEATGMRLVCTAPKDVRLINGASATLEITTKKAKNVLVLPVEAVAGLHGEGQVEVVLPDGTREVREVKLGLTDGKVVEIKSGLTGDETVAVPGPNLPAAEPNQEEGKPGMPVPGSK